MQSLSKALACGVALCCVAAASGQTTSVFPTTAHAAFNFIPFGSGGAAMTPIQHQVFRADLFGATPVEITSIGFAPNNTLVGQPQNLGDVTIRLGYTSRTPGALPPTGLDIPASAGGAPNATGSMSVFFTQTAFSYTPVTGGSTNFEMDFVGTPFVYDPAQGNLLVEIVCENTTNTTMSVSRSSGSAESSRAYAGGRFGAAASSTTATRMEFVYRPVTSGCYPNCDNSTTTPILNVQDFTCFLQRYAAGESYANCDQSTVAPVLNVQDFTCFLQAYAAGCP